VTAPVPFDSIEFTGGYWPNTVFDDATNPSNIIRAGRNLWPRADGRQEPIKGSVAVNDACVGSRIFEADNLRAEIAGGFVGNRLPYVSLVKYANSVYFFVGEIPNQQVYLDETPLPGVTTGAEPYKLRLAYQKPDGSWFCGDAGLPTPTLPGANVVAEAGGVKYTATTAAKISVKLAAIDFYTDAQSNPSEAVQVQITGGGTNRVRVTLPAPATPRINGYVIGATPWKRGEEGPWSQVRPAVRLTLEGTFTATNGDPIITAGIETKASLRLRAGDEITIDGTTYTVLSVQDDQNFTLTGNFTGATGSGKTVNTVSVVLDYYNEELGRDLPINNDPPLRCLGVLVFNNRLLIYGCAESVSQMPGALVLASRAENPEAFPLDDSTNQIQTVTGDALLGVQTAATRLFLLTRNGIDVASYTGDEETPFLTRRAYSPGVFGPKNAIAAGGLLYSFASKKAIRVLPDDTVDQEFGTAVENVLEQWHSENVVLVTDPRNAAVLYCNYDMARNTTQVLPWMMNLNQWATPQYYSGRITDGVSVNGVLYLVIYQGGNYCIFEYEGGDGSTTAAYAATEYLYGSAELNRKSLQRLFFTGKASELRAYLAPVGGPVPNVDNAFAAAATFPLSNAEQHEEQIYTNLPPCRSYALRVDLSGANSYISKLVSAGDYLPAR